VAAMALAMLVTAVVIWLVGERFGRLSAEELAPLGATGGDAIPFSAALGYMLLLGLLGLAVGAVAFALAPFVGRGAAAGISGGLMAASWLVYGYRESISLFDRLLFLSPYEWTAGHRPVAGTYDWPALLPLVAVIVAGFVVGTMAFERRDLGRVGSVHLPRLPARLLGLRGPWGRSLSDRASLGLSWGIGIGAYAFIVANAGSALRDSLVDNPGLLGIIESVFPNIDVDAPGFALQLAFLVMGYLGTGLAAARLVNGWALEEAEGRLELVLATSMGRLRWFLGSAAGVFAALLLLVVVIAIGMGLGVASTGDGVLGPMLGAGTLLLYGSAVAGVGFAFAGLWSSEAATIAALVLVVITLLLDILVPALGLPDWVHNLALTGHFGEPLVGEWNLVGVGASLVLALGGLAVGTWGFSRRDLRG
jgi:ABC-2 type transport system permease protein